MAYYITYLDSNGNRHYTVNFWNDVLKTVTMLRDHIVSRAKA